MWRGRHVHQDVPVAIKVLTGRAGSLGDEVEAFTNEVHSVARLAHPGIITVFDHGLVPASMPDPRLPVASPWLAMELATGGTLGDLVRTPLSWDELRRILADILSALAHAHARGVIHRDLKPANILLAGPDDLRPGLKLTDFGIAHALADDARATRDMDGTVSGTMRYMAPEQVLARVRDQGPWTDLYALGAIAYQLASGSPLFPGAKGYELVQAHLHVPILKVPSRTAVPPGFPAWVQRLLAKRPSDRFENAADAAWALEQLGAPDEATITAVSEAPKIADDDETVVETRLSDKLTEVDVLAHTGDSSSLPRQAVAPALPPRDLPSWRLDSGARRSMKLEGAGLSLYGLRPVPLVDREPVRDQLWDALRAVSSGGGARLVALTGLAGQGKTRIVQWFAERVSELGVATVVSATHAPLSGLSDGLSAMVRRYLRCVGLGREATLERAVDWLATWGAAMGEEPGRSEASAEALALTEFMLPAAEEDDPSGARVRLLSSAERHEVLRRWLERLAAKRTVVVWLDDVQWGSDALAFATHVLSTTQARGQRLLFVLTARSELMQERDGERLLLEGLLRRDTSVQSAIAPLAQGDHRTLVQELLGLEGDLAARVCERTEGNPLFAVQLVGDWVQRGVLEVGADGFTLREGVEAAVPDDIHALWAGRVAHVMRTFGDRADDALRALEMGAALGGQVANAEWRDACAAAHIRIPKGLVARLEAMRLATTRDGGWMVEHGMLRESLARVAAEEGRWAEHHRVCEATLEQRYGQDPRVAERRGRHLLEAGELAAAEPLLLHGARQRARNSEFRQSHEVHDVREDCLRALNVPEKDPRWAWGWLRRSRVLVAQGDLDAGTALADRALPGLDALGEAANVHAIHGYAAMGKADMQSARLHFETARDDLSPSLEALADILHGLGSVLIWLRDLDAAETTLKAAYELEVSAGNGHGQGRALRGLANLANCHGRLDQAADVMQQALEAFEKHGDRAGVGMCKNDLGDIRRVQRRWDAARMLYTEAAALFDAVGGKEATTPRLNMALMLLGQGRVLEARTIYTQLLHTIEASDRTMDALWAVAGLYACAAQEADWTAFDAHEARFRAGLDESGAVDEDLAECARRAGEGAATHGEWDRANPALELAAELFERLQQPDEAAAARAQRSEPPTT